MDLKDIVVSQTGCENPKLHTIQVNDSLFNVAIEMQLITLIGASVDSVNSEYRQFNADSKLMKQLLSGKLSTSPVGRIYGNVKKHIDSQSKGHTITRDNVELKNVSGDGIAYMIVYYLLIKRFDLNEEDFVNLNKFTIVAPVVKLFDTIISDKKVVISAVELKVFSKFMLNYYDYAYKVGSKLVPLTRHQIENISDIKQTIWKSIYINQLVRNISFKQRKFLFAPNMDWGVARCSAKHTFTNDHIVSKVMFGENINYIRSSASKQLKLSTELSKGQIYDQELDDIKRLTFELRESTKDIDYALGDLSMVLFYPNIGKSLFREIGVFIEESKMNKQIAKDRLIAPMIMNHNVFKQVIFQFLYANFLLTKLGVIHNDPHLNNILVSERSGKKSTRKVEYFLSPGKNVSVEDSDIQLTIIDFDKSILSHHHHNHFGDTVDKINEEIAVIFNEDFKKTISEDFAQVFNCYSMYDIVKFSLIMKRLLVDIDDMIGHTLPKNIIKLHLAFLDKIIKLASDVLSKIFDKTPKLPFAIAGTHSGMEWLILTIYSANIHIIKSKSSINKTLAMVDAHSSTSSDQPEFVSSRRKYADTLKYNFISQYVSSMK